MRRFCLREQRGGGGGARGGCGCGTFRWWWFCVPRADDGVAELHFPVHRGVRGDHAAAVSAKARHGAPRRSRCNRNQGGVR